MTQSELDNELDEMAKDATKWVVDEIADPTADLATLFKLIADRSQDPAVVGAQAIIFLVKKIEDLVEARK